MTKKKKKVIDLAEKISQFSFSLSHIVDNPLNF